MEEKTADEIAAIFSAAGDSVTVIGTAQGSDETDIEFKNLSIIDQTQTFFLDLNKNWLSVKSQKDSQDGKSDFSKTEFKASDSIIFSISISKFGS